MPETRGPGAVHHRLRFGISSLPAEGLNIPANIWKPIRALRMRMLMQGIMDAYRTGHVHEMACMVHIRREFVKVHDSYKLPAAAEAIARIKKLYEVENRARFKSPEERVTTAARACQTYIR
jgi:hypothetical protein